MCPRWRKWRTWWPCCTVRTVSWRTRSKTCSARSTNSSRNGSQATLSCATSNWTCTQGERLFLIFSPSGNKPRDVRIFYWIRFVNADFRNGTETVSIMFSKPEKRANWEESFNEAKQKLGEYIGRKTEEVSSSWPVILTNTRSRPTHEPTQDVMTFLRDAFSSEFEPPYSH